MSTTSSSAATARVATQRTHNVTNGHRRTLTGT
jgi:hypothetical protein